MRKYLKFVTFAWAGVFVLVAGLIVGLGFTVSCDSNDGAPMDDVQVEAPADTSEADAPADATEDSGADAEVEEADAKEADASDAEDASEEAE